MTVGEFCLKQTNKVGVPCHYIDFRKRENMVILQKTYIYKAKF